MPNYPQEQLSQLYEKLPQELQDAIFSEENGQNIQDICKKNGVNNEDQVLDTIRNTAYVLMGLLPPNELADVLEKEVNIEGKVAQQISREIKRFVFYPVKKTLEALYGTTITYEDKPEALGQPSIAPAKGTKSSKDRYLEPIE